MSPKKMIFFEFQMDVGDGNSNVFHIFLFGVMGDFLRAFEWSTSE